MDRDVMRVPELRGQGAPEVGRRAGKGTEKKVDTVVFLPICKIPSPPKQNVCAKHSLERDLKTNIQSLSAKKLISL